MPNAFLQPARRVSAFRRIAAAAWRRPREPAMFGTMSIPAGALEEWILRKRRETGEHVTVTHAVARAVAVLLGRNPELNAVVRWRRLQLRRDVDVFVQVAIEDPDQVGRTDLSGAVIRNADRKDVAELAREIRAAASRIRGGRDADFARQKSLSERLPPLLFGCLLRLLDFLQWGLNVDTRLLGAPRDPFGSAMVTSLGMRGVEVGYAPFFPLARNPLIVLVGAIAEAPVAEDGRVVARRMLTLNATFDHRVYDGVHASVVAAELRGLLEHPEGLEPPAAASVVP